MGEEIPKRPKKVEAGGGTIKQKADLVIGFSWFQVDDQTGTDHRFDAAKRRSLRPQSTL